MRVIQKQISLEDFTSRLPGVVPAYVPGTSTPICFDEASLKKRDNAYTSNYGLVPMNVKKDGKCYSWETISDWYHFFTDYYHLLNDWSHCNRKYTSAHGFYIGETRDRHYDSLPYGTSESTYIELDDLFNRRKALIPYDYICNNLIPSIDIPREYQDYWHTSKLFYPDYIKWKGWFIDRHELYKNYDDSTDCSGAADCCDCTEYFNRGGNDMYGRLTSATFNIPTDTGNCCNPEFITDISLLVSIDDMGEFSIFSEEYNLGTDYRTGTYGSTDNTNGGTVVSISGNAMTLKDKPAESENDYPGFGFNEDYMEKYYDENQWDVHNGNTRVNGWSEEDANVRYYQETAPTGCYGFDKNMAKKIGADEETVRSIIVESFPVTQISSILINGRLYAVQSEEYGDYNGKRYYVYRDKYTDTPYTTINGRTLYANILSTPSADAYFYFKVFTASTSTTKDECNNTVDTLKYKTFPRVRNGNTEKFVIYNGGTYVVTNNKVTINGTVYDVLTGTFENEYGTYYIIGRNVYLLNEYGGLELDEDYYYANGIATKKTNESVKVYTFGIITGFTTSKIYDLASSDLLVDDTGTKLEGRRPEIVLPDPDTDTGDDTGDDPEPTVTTTYNYQPKEGEVLELLYEVGNTSKRIEKMSTLTTDDIDAEINYFFGGIITAMKFYFLDKLGNIYQEIDWENSSLSTINSMNRASAEEEAFSNYTSLEDGVYCDIEYLVGATLQRKSGEKLKLAEDTEDKKFCHGVKYKETVRFIKKDVQYNLSTGIDGQIPTTENNVDANNLSYPVTIYELDQFNKNSDSKAVAYFEMELPSQTDWEGYEYSMACFPVFREEYKFGNSVLQNVDADIYIDRGINAAFEKHLKLGEVTSMEALEQYGNGYFKFQTD